MLSQILAGYLGQYIDAVGLGGLKASVYRGEITLKDLQLKKEVCPSCPGRTTARA